MSESPPDSRKKDAPRLHAVAAAGGALARKEDPDAILRRLEWTVIRRLDGLLQGDYRTLFRAFGLDLADLREYQLHDDVRHIDWNVTARLQTPYVREFHADREVTAWFLLDLSGSVDFGSGNVRKRALSTELTAVLGRLLTRHGNRVGAILYSDKIDGVVPAGAGRRHVLQILDRMMKPAAPAARKETNLGDLMEKAQSAIKRRSVIFVVSDFISTPGWARGLALLARRHEIVAVRLYDPLEMELPDLGLIVMQDAETGEQLFVDTHDARFRRQFAEAALRREAALRAALSEAGVDCLELATDDDLVDALMRFTVLRKRRSQLAAGVSLTSHR
ncbi:MAG TPA: DUF58 domain-containing protein [Burkholderiales bacterium]|jgi:uncharacterized protein (DUF58 family)|nr:DUF58 domain-containing protein [Burkholderiales bacterium]